VLHVIHLKLATVFFNAFKIKRIVDYNVTCMLRWQLVCFVCYDSFIKIFHNLVVYGDVLILLEKF
jgi:hypothetical protein